MRRVVLFGILLIVLVGVTVVGGWLIWQRGNSESLVSPLGKFLAKPLDKYTIPALTARAPQGGPIVLDTPLATTSAYTVYAFHFTTEGKKVTGLAHIPMGSGPFPVVVQFRGYIDRAQYHSGDGTRRSAEVYAKNGYLSLAPDFLGYGGSDAPSLNSFEERFQTYTTALDLLGSIKAFSLADATRVGIWGHSNGGHIALTVLEILGSPIPTTLWAPVTRPFPYSILYFTDEASDSGKLMRKKLAEFESQYDVDEYTLTNYFDRIAAPLQLHQGTADEAVPLRWSTDSIKKLEALGKTVQYFVYPDADHNMLGAWSTVVARDIEFFDRELR